MDHEEFVSTLPLAELRRLQTTIAKRVDFLEFQEKVKRCTPSEEEWKDIQQEIDQRGYSLRLLYCDRKLMPWGHASDDLPKGLSRILLPLFFDLTARDIDKYDGPVGVQFSLSKAIIPGWTQSFPEYQKAVALVHVSDFKRWFAPTGVDSKSGWTGTPAHYRYSTHASGMAPHVDVSLLFRTPSWPAPGWKGRVCYDDGDEFNAEVNGDHVRLGWPGGFQKRLHKYDWNLRPPYVFPPIVPKTKAPAAKVR